MTTYAITGATGGLGGGAIAELLARGVTPSDIVAVVRDPAKATSLAAAGVEVRSADYEAPDALRTALAGVDRLLLVSGNQVGRRTQHHRNVIEAATAAGVSLIAYTSILGAPTSPLTLATEHVATEELLAATAIPTVVLRNGWYWDNYIPGAQSAIESGVLYGSAGQGRIAAAARADYAAAAAVALVDADGGEIYELAGDSHLTYADIAAAIAEVSGTPVRYQNIPEADLAAALEQAGIPAPMPAILANSDAGIALGALDSDSTALASLLGRPLTTLVEVLTPALTGATA